MEDLLGVLMTPGYLHFLAGSRKPLSTRIVAPLSQESGDAAVPSREELPCTFRRHGVQSFEDWMEPLNPLSSSGTILISEKAY
jgi:hypothetical protein